MYIRVYDYGVAHNIDAAGCCWRYETELKGRTANRCAALLMQKTQRELAIKQLVSTLCTDRRLELPFAEADLRIDIRPRSKSTVERKLDWLGKQVAPAVAKLIDAGYIEAAIEALGLAEWVSINPPNLR